MRINTTTAFRKKSGVYGRGGGGVKRFVCYSLIVCIFVSSAIHFAFNLYYSAADEFPTSRPSRSRDFVDRFKAIVFGVLPSALFGVVNVRDDESDLTFKNFLWNNETAGNDFYYLPTHYVADYTFLLDGRRNITCLKEGTDGGLKGDRTSPLDLCPCKDGWHGTSCSIPSVVYRSETPWKKDSVALRRHPRRIIQAFPFNIEFEMLEIRFAELYDVVDVFLILESNYTAFGEHKELHLLERLKNGTYRAYADKIVYVLLDFFPEGGRKDGWIADAIHRNHIGTHGLKKIKNWSNDDLFFLSDADEIPSRKALLFLKLHDGYTEPISYAAWWTVYGFFWTPSNNDAGSSGRPGVQYLSSGVTMGMLVYVFRREVYNIRSATTFIGQHPLDVNVYIKMGGKVGGWTIGTDRLAAGWHCSWCLDAAGIRLKLLSAQNGDFPRWGDYPAKTNVTYIGSLVRRGLWFDDNGRMMPVNVSSTFVPQHVWVNRDRYRRIVSNPYT